VARRDGGDAETLALAPQAHRLIVLQLDDTHVNFNNSCRMFIRFIF
jgi:hypothetical protein